jgi:hypothetical protein
MNASYRFTLLSLAAVALLPLQQGRAADPEHKPKLVPRGIPGMSKGETPSTPSSRAALKATSFKSVQPVTKQAADPSAQAQIITIYRRGTFPLPPSSNETAAPAATLETTAPSAPKVPPPGKVRILSKEEADNIVKQPDK